MLFCLLVGSHSIKSNQFEVGHRRETHELSQHSVNANTRKLFARLTLKIEGHLRVLRAHIE